MASSATCGATMHARRAQTSSLCRHALAWGGSGWYALHVTVCYIRCLQSTADASAKPHRSACLSPVLSQALLPRRCPSFTANQIWHRAAARANTARTSNAMNYCAFWMRPVPLPAAGAHRARQGRFDSVPWRGQEGAASAVAPGHCGAGVDRVSGCVGGGSQSAGAGRRGHVVNVCEFASSPSCTHVLAVSATLT